MSTTNDLPSYDPEFTEAEIAQDPILAFFKFEHLPPVLKLVSMQYFYLARWTFDNIRRSPERTVALRKLLESKDAAVRSAL